MFENDGFCRHHRWTRNNVCARPGCRAEREKDAPLKPHETMHHTGIPAPRVGEHARINGFGQEMQALLTAREVGELLGVQAGQVSKLGRRGVLAQVVLKHNSRQVIGYDPFVVNAVRNARRERRSG